MDLAAPDDWAMDFVARDRACSWSSEGRLMADLQTTVANPFADLDLDRLRTRTCAKWNLYPTDVLPLWVAEMDAYVAQPIVDAVMAALANGDTGYPWGRGYAEAYASYASDRWGYSPDITATAMVADVMSGVR
ncbi:MAG TPA: hypothetical protein DEG70_07790, partial [Chloroflexi bacterium]|nr:hypothetical protein [Chloroflexota bacterium]